MWKRNSINRMREHCDSLKWVNLLFLRVWRRRVTMLQLMMMMMRWGPAYHKTDNSDTVYWETVPQDSFIVLSTYRRDKNVRTKKTDGQHESQIGLIWAHTSQLTQHGIRHSLQCVSTGPAAEPSGRFPLPLLAGGGMGTPSVYWQADGGDLYT